MKSMPVIEGLSNDDMTKYKNFVNDLNNFTLSYNKYIQDCNANNNTCTGVDNSDVKVKLNTLGVNSDGTLNPNGSLVNFQQVVNNNQITGNTFELNNELLKKRSELKSDIQILTDVENSIEGDYITKMKSSFYTNTLTYVGLACIIYYTFHQISSSK